MNDDFIHDAYFEEMEPAHASNALPHWNHSNGNGNKKEGFFKRCFNGIFRFMRRGFALLGFLVVILIAVCVFLLLRPSEAEESQNGVEAVQPLKPAYTRLTDQIGHMLDALTPKTKPVEAEAESESVELQLPPEEPVPAGQTETLSPTDQRHLQMIEHAMKLNAKRRYPKAIKNKLDHLLGVQSDEASEKKDEEEENQS